MWDRNAYMAEWRDENREKLRAYQREYMKARRAADPERAKEISRASNARRRQSDLEAARKRDRDFYHNLSTEAKRERAAKNRESSREKIRLISREWAKRNVGKVNSRTAQRRALKKQAMPLWADNSAIRRIYQDCVRRSKATGMRHEVDHIIPLQGKNVCGLHVAENLQIITAMDNRLKSNKFQEGVVA